MENKNSVSAGLGGITPAQQKAQYFSDITPRTAQTQPAVSATHNPDPLFTAPPPNLRPTLPQPIKKQSPLTRTTKAFGVVALALLLLLGGVFLFLSRLGNQASKDPEELFKIIEIPLEDIASSGSTLLETRSLTINGNLITKGGLLLSPSGQPSTASPGQIYYDNTSNQLAYYNGSQFVPIGGAGDTFTTINNTGVTSLGGLSGAVGLGSGLTAAGGLLQNTGVLSILGGTGINVSNANGVITVSGEGNNNGYVQGGNSFGTTAILGTTDAHNLHLVVNNTSVMKLTTDSKVAVNGLLSLSSSYSQDQFSIRNNTTDSTLTMGANVIGNPSNDGGQDRNLDYIQASKFNSGPGGTIDSLRVFFTIVDNANPHFKVAVYSDNAGSPGTLLSSSTAPSTVAGAANTWSSASLGNTVTLTPNTNYWLALATETDGTWYARQDGGVDTTKYQSGFPFNNNFPATYTVTDVTSRYMSIYAPYITITDQSAAVSGIVMTENNEMAFRPLFNSDTTFGVTNASGVNLLNVNALDNYVGLRQLMIGGADTNYAAFMRSSASSGVLGLWRDTTIASENLMQLMSNIGGSGTVKLRITADGSVYVGNATADSSGALLVLDTKNTAGDPTGADGAMYYNSNMTAMRCYFDNKWRFCNEPLSKSWGYEWSDDFISGNNVSNTGSVALIGEQHWTEDASGAGAGFGGDAPDAASRVGQIHLDTGTTASGRDAIY
ncbi:MAG TPA: choice-of-anchor R domain-containing protein, partial [Candidatus Saccharimonadales bacterium]|nr:choice-of-anchor R domain-containing protein [Candidatus Saccharimonadales bacterium]